MGASESKSRGHGANNHVVKKGRSTPHFITIKGLELDVVKVLLGSAAEMKSLVARCGGDDRLKHRILASVFYEPSTRTSCSFSAAMLRLGGQVVTVNDQQSSVAKGESLDDTMQTMACYCDATVLRHPEKGSAAQAAGVSTKPIINAGDGTGEHPTQAMLDLFTIESELGTLLSASAAAPLTVVLLGDLKHGRTVHSLVRLLALFAAVVKLVYVSPPTLSMPQELCDELAALHVQQSTASSLAEAIVDADVLYVTRIQKERFASAQEYEAVAGSYCVDNALMAKAKAKMVVMHPLPRLKEISTEVDTDPRAAYFRQMENGMFMRMALLDMIINEHPRPLVL